MQPNGYHITSPQECAPIMNGVTLREMIENKTKWCLQNDSAKQFLNQNRPKIIKPYEKRYISMMIRISFLLLKSFGKENLRQKRANECFIQHSKRMCSHGNCLFLAGKQALFGITVFRNINTFIGTVKVVKHGL